MHFNISAFSSRKMLNIHFFSVFRKHYATYYNHGCIIKWTQHIGFLTLAGMERVIEENHGNDLKEG